MAEACIKVVEEVVTTVKLVDVFQLTLSKEEAQFVLDYLGNTVTGQGLRKHSDSVCTALTKAGVKYDDDFHLHIVGELQLNCFRNF